MIHFHNFCGHQQECQEEEEEEEEEDEEEEDEEEEKKKQHCCKKGTELYRNGSMRSNMSIFFVFNVVSD